MERISGVLPRFPEGSKQITSAKAMAKMLDVPYPRQLQLTSSAFIVTDPTFTVRFAFFRNSQ
jgi:hypothetical protein